MEFRIRKIVFEEKRPFSISDFLSFEVDGREYSMTAGTFRNNLVNLRKNGMVELAFKSDKAYYTLQGKKFPKPMKTSDPEVVSTVSSVSSQSSSIEFAAAIQGREDGITPIYKWIEPLSAKKQSLHDIRLTFEAKGIWNRFSQLYSDLINPKSKDIVLEKWIFLTDDIEVTVTIHHTDIVSIALACSYKPIAIDVPDLFHLIEVLTRSEARLSAIAAESSVPSTYSDNNNSNIAVPRYTTWTVVMWHFGVDSIDSYDGKEFHVTFEHGANDLYRIYTKRMRDNSNIVRAERQEYPHKPPIDAIMDKLYAEKFLT